MLNYEEIGKHAERITKIKHFINKYKCKGINFPSQKDNWKKIEKNNVAIPLNTLYVKKDYTLSLFKSCKASYSLNDFKHRRIFLKSYLFRRNH